MKHRVTRNFLLNSLVGTAVPVVVILTLSVALAAPVKQEKEAMTGRARPLEAAQESKGPLLHFAKAAAYNSGAWNAQFVVAADVDGDGIPDLVVANLCQTSPNYCYFGSGGGVVGVLLGNGDGTFQPAITYDSGGLEAASVAVGDVNGDGKPDIAVANNYSYVDNYGAVAVLLSNGNGTFQAATSYGSGGYVAQSVAIAELNGDGKPDLIVANSDGVVVLKGNGDGTFQPAVEYSSGGGYPVSVVVADLNGDAKADLVVANLASSSVTVLLGNGDGTFQAPVSYNSGGENARSVALGDVNGDGQTDLAVVNGCRVGRCPKGEVTVLLGNGDGTFQSPSSFNFVRRYGFWVVIGDLNGDGKGDLAVASGCPPSDYYTECNYPGEVSVLAGNGDGTFQSPVTYYPGGWYPLFVAIADVNADAKPDLLVTSICGFDNCGFGSVGVLLNDFTAKTIIQVTSSPNPSLVGQPVTFTATITSNPPIPDGEAVTFYNGKASIGTGTTTNGVAAVTTSFAKAKTYTIRASYEGDLYHKARSATVKQVVEQ